jgi:predicted helicase
MKLALTLQETGYAFDEDREHPDRVKVFLTNSLEEADKEGGQGMMFEQDALAEESLAAKETKKNKGINVVIGNPPYSGESANKGSWIMSLMEDYKKEPGGIEKLKEKNPKWINNDYVKFIRYGQKIIEKSGEGIIALINSNSYLDGLIFRGMRWNLLSNFNSIHIINLHGNSKKNEIAPDGTPDENVFDITEGVCINIFIKNKKKGSKDHTKVYYHDLYGKRERKYTFLLDNNITSMKWYDLSFQSPQYFLIQRSYDNQEKYENGFSVIDLFPINVLGFQTHRDHFAIAIEKSAILERSRDLINNELSDSIISDKYSISDNRDWNLSRARHDIQNDKHWQEKVIICHYRPFDDRHCYFSEVMMDYPRLEFMEHFLRGENIGLVLCRQQKTNGFYHCLIQNTIV